MRFVPLLCVLLVLSSIPALAGEYLINEEVAYGLRVTFTEAVTITYFGDVLVEVSPEGEAVEFIFSGAELPAWVGHGLAWTPGAANIASYEWLAEVPMANGEKAGDTVMGCPPGDVEIDHGWLLEGNGQLQDWAGVYHMGTMADTPFPSDGVLWGSKYSDDASEWEATIVGMLHYLLDGKPYLMAEPASTFSEPHPELEDSVAMVDVAGNLIVWEDRESWQMENVHRHNVFHPQMQELIRSHLRAMIDAGATGATFDDYGAENIIYYGGTFDDWTESEFRDYLRARNTDSDLVGRYGISNLDGFSIAKWIREHGLTHTWNRAPFEPIVWQYILFLFELEHDVFEDLADYAHEYARVEQGRDFLIGVNAHPAYGWLGRLAESCDYLTREDFAPHEPSRALADLFEALDPEKPRVFLVEFEDNPSQGTMQAQVISDLVIREMGLLFTSGASVLLPRDIFRHTTGGQYGEAVQIDNEAISAMVQHVANHRELYSADQIPSRVGVVFDEASNLNSVSIAGYGWWGWSQNVLKGTAEILYRAHIPFEFIYVSDPRFSDRRIRQSDLSRYDVVVLPDSLSLPHYVQELLLEFSHNGGTLVATGDGAKYDLDMNIVTTGLRSTLIGAKRVTGQGKVFYITTDPGKELAQRGSTSAGRELLAALAEATELTVDLENENIVVTLAECGVSILVHLSNTSYAKQTDQLVPTGDIQLSLKGLPLDDFSCVLVSPETCGYQRVDSQADGGWVRFAVPSFRSTVTLILTPQNVRPFGLAAQLSESEQTAGIFSASVSLGGAAMQPVEWRIGDTTVLTQSVTDEATFRFRVGPAATYPLELRCADMATGDELHHWELSEVASDHGRTVLYDFEPVGEVATRQGEIELHGRAKASAEDGLAGVSYFDDRGALIEPAVTEETQWEGSSSLQIGYTALFDDGWQRLFTGVRLIDLPSSGLSSARYLELAYQLENPAMSVFFVFTDRENEAFSYGGRVLQCDGLWHTMRVPLSSFRFGGYGSPPDGNGTLDLDGLKGLDVYLVLEDSKGTTEYLYLDDIALSD